MSPPRLKRSEGHFCDRDVTAWRLRPGNSWARNVLRRSGETDMVERYRPRLGQRVRREFVGHHAGDGPKTDRPLTLTAPCEPGRVSRGPRTKTAARTLRSVVSDVSAACRST